MLAARTHASMQFVQISLFLSLLLSVTSHFRPYFSTLLVGCYSLYSDSQLLFSRCSQSEKICLGVRLMVSYLSQQHTTATSWRISLGAPPVYQDAGCCRSMKSHMTLTQSAAFSASQATQCTSSLRHSRKRDTSECKASDL